MKLFYTVTSPYSRKVRITAVEKGIELESIIANPFDDVPELKAANPLGAIPTLLTDDGEPLFDSPVICAYLDSQNSEPRLIPEGADKWKVWRAEALADGVMDAAFSIVMENRRPDQEQSNHWKQRWTAAINRAIDSVEKDVKSYETGVTMAQISLAAALSYLDFRLPHLEWRNNRPGTAAWYETFSQRESMKKTDDAK